MAARKSPPSPARDRLSNLQAVLAKLREVTIFAHLNDEEIRAVASLFEQASASAGTQFVWRGGMDTALYIIRAGRVFARRPDNRYTEEQLAASILHEGWAFNQDSFLTGQPNEHTFEAMDQGTTVWRVPRDGFLKLWEMHPTLRNNLNAPQLIAPSTVTVEEVQAAAAKEAALVNDVAPTVMADHAHIPDSSAPFDIFSALRAKGPFKGLDTAVIQEMVQDRTVLEPKPGEMIVERGSGNTSLYIVVEGRIAIREATDKYVDKLKGIVGPGGTANDLPFMTGRQNYEALEATNGLKVWVIKREQWLSYLIAHPSLIGELQPEPAIKKILDDQAKHPWMNEGEELLVYQRKHRWTIVESIWLSVLLLLIVVGVAIVLPQIRIYDISPYELLTKYQFRGVSLGLVTLVMIAMYLIINIGLGIYDWYDDFYAVTDQRAVHQEKKLLQSSQFSGSAIENIQNVTVARKSLASVFFNMGDVDIEMFGTGERIVFRNITSPEAVAKAITTQQHQRLITIKAIDREMRREQIRRQMEVKDRPGDLPAAPKPKMNVRSNPWDTLLDRVLGRSLQKWLGTLLPVQRLVIGDEIVYRKHPFDLFLNTIAPLSALFVYGVIVLYIWFSLPVLAVLLFSWPVVVLVGGISLVLFLWFAYQYEDWRNDFFVLGKDRVIDIERKPLGISSQRREAAFDKIQNITAKTSGTINQLFNIGDVVIATGATGSELVWQRVSNPQQIQIEIQTRIEMLRRKRDEDKIIDEYRRWAEWLGMYDELARVHERGQLK